MWVMTVQPVGPRIFRIILIKCASRANRAFRTSHRDFWLGCSSGWLFPPDEIRSVEYSIANTIFPRVTTIVRRDFGPTSLFQRATTRIKRRSDSVHNFWRQMESPAEGEGGGMLHCEISKNQTSNQIGTFLLSWDIYCAGNRQKKKKI